jgi:hypothetical protein
VDLEWRPEPTAEEREALELALARALAERPEPRSAWWREGVLESVSPEPDDEL